MIAALFSFAICNFSGKSLRTRMYVGIVSLRSSVPVRTLFENNETGGSNYALRKKTEQDTKKKPSRQQSDRSCSQRSQRMGASSEIKKLVFLSFFLALYVFQTCLHAPIFAYYYHYATFKTGSKERKHVLTRPAADYIAYNVYIHTANFNSRLLWLFRVGHIRFFSRF